MRRQWSHATALTPALVDARSRATAACEMVWRKARADSDFKAFAKAFRPVLDLTREVAAAKADAFGHPAKWPPRKPMPSDSAPTMPCSTNTSPAVALHDSTSCLPRWEH